jgi:hypothetical protein
MYAYPIAEIVRFVFHAVEDFLFFNCILTVISWKTQFYLPVITVLYNKTVKADYKNCCFVEMWQCGCGFGILGLCICIVTWLQPGEKPHIHDVLQAASCSWKPCWEKWTWYVGWQQQGLGGSLLEAAWGSSWSCCVLAQNNAKGCTETCREGGESVNSRDLANWQTAGMVSRYQIVAGALWLNSSKCL